MVLLLFPLNLASAAMASKIYSNRTAHIEYMSFVPFVNYQIHFLSQFLVVSIPHSVFSVNKKIMPAKETAEKNCLQQF